jgi:hypothetical protein
MQIIIAHFCLSWIEMIKYEPFCGIIQLNRFL